MDIPSKEDVLRLLDRKHSKVYNSPNRLKNKIFKRKKEVTVVITSYNAKKHIKKCISSVMNQSLSFDKIELIIVDDHSKDGTAKILIDYAKRYSNITVVLLKENTGTAAMPRNIGIELATTEKIMFLDSDDWLDKGALLALLTKMDENNDDLVLGQTIKVEDKGESIHAEFLSYKERKHVNPFEFPYLFYYMGPQSKLMKTSILKENMIYFPELKFGEDKFFLFNVYLKCQSVSTIQKPICYLNRLSANNGSLTKTTNILEKRTADLKILKKILDLKMPEEQEKLYVKRLMEYDLIRTCDSMVFVRSNEQEKFIEIIRQAFTMLKDKSYNIVNMFDSPLYQAAGELIKLNRDKDFIELFKWYKLDKNKEIVIKEGIAYYNVPLFSDHDPYKFIPLDLYAQTKHAYVEKHQFVQTFEIYGKNLEKIEYILVRDRANYLNETKVPVIIEGNTATFRMDVHELDQLSASLYNVLIRFDGYRLANIKNNGETKVTFNNRNFIFYTTKMGNLSLSVKE